MKLFAKLVLEFTPLVLLLVFTERYDVYVGAAVLLVATVISLILVWWLFHKIAIMAILTAVTGIGAAALTVWFTDPIWVKLKPTIVSLMFAGILAFGLARKQPLLQRLLGEDLNLTDQGWRIVTGRWVLYFILIAVANEVVWRTAELIWHAEPAVADRVWARSKVYFIMPFTLFYAWLQLPLLRKYRDRHDLPGGLADMEIFGGPGEPARPAEPPVNANPPRQNPEHGRSPSTPRKQPLRQPS